MQPPRSILRRTLMLLVMAALLLPALAGGTKDNCCPADGPGRETACACDSRGVAEHGGAADDGGSAHSKAFCDCPSCDIPSICFTLPSLRTPELVALLDPNALLPPRSPFHTDIFRPPCA